jgi:hypothetical protein
MRRFIIFGGDVSSLEGGALDYKFMASSLQEAKNRIREQGRSWLATRSTGDRATGWYQICEIGERQLRIKVNGVVRLDPNGDVRIDGV